MTLHSFALLQCLGTRHIPVLGAFSRETWVHVCSGMQTLGRRRDTGGQRLSRHLVKWKELMFWLTTMPPSPPGHFTVTYSLGNPTQSRWLAHGEGATKGTCESMWRNVFKSPKRGTYTALLLKPCLSPGSAPCKDDSTVPAAQSPPRRSPQIVSTISNCLGLAWPEFHRWWDLHL